MKPQSGQTVRSRVSPSGTVRRLGPRKELDEVGIEDTMAGKQRRCKDRGRGRHMYRLTQARSAEQAAPRSWKRLCSLQMDASRRTATLNDFFEDFVRAPRGGTRHRRWLHPATEEAFRELSIHGRRSEERR